MAGSQRGGGRSAGAALKQRFNLRQYVDGCCLLEMFFLIIGLRIDLFNLFIFLRIHLLDEPLPPPETPSNRKLENIWVEGLGVKVKGPGAAADTVSRR